MGDRSRQTGKAGDKVSMGQQRPSLAGGGSQKTPLCLCWAHERSTAEAAGGRRPGVCLCMGEGVGQGTWGHGDTDSMTANGLSFYGYTDINPWLGDA